MKVLLRPGEAVTIKFEDEHCLLLEGEIVATFGEDSVKVEADLPDSSCRSGVIYYEQFSQGLDHKTEVKG